MFAVSKPLTLSLQIPHFLMSHGLESWDIDLMNEICWKTSQINFQFITFYSRQRSQGGLETSN